MHLLENTPTPQPHNTDTNVEPSTPVEVFDATENLSLTGITTDEFKVLIKGLTYLEHRDDLTYHSKIAKRAFGSQTKARSEEGKYEGFVGMLDALVDHEVLATKHGKYGFADGKHLTNVDYSEVFTITPGE